jgi:hypothetical protein
MWAALIGKHLVIIVKIAHSEDGFLSNEVAAFRKLIPAVVV